MRVVQLSDSVTQQRRLASIELTNAVKHRDTLQRDGFARLRALDEAMLGRAVWRRVLNVSTWEMRRALRDMVEIKKLLAEAQKEVERLERAEGVKRAGEQGEKAFEEALRSLNNHWTMLRGFTNRRGETDSLIVGPGGVWAVEVKNWNARVSAIDGEWMYERIDAEGHVTDSGLALDGGGRSWAREVGDVADELVRQLRAVGHDVAIRTAVMLVHPKARIGLALRPGVDLISTDPNALIAELTRPDELIHPDDCAVLVDAIRELHREGART